MDNITLHLGDCVKYMRKMEDKSIDAIITDPPYGVNIDYNMFVDNKENLEALLSMFMPEVLRISNCVIIFCGNGNQHLYPAPKWTLCWHIPAGAGYNPWGFTTWQPILAYGKPYREKGRAYPDSFSMSPASDKCEHPCSKPVPLLKAVIDRYTAPGWTIFDPFMGSGTTGVACVRLKRKFIGCEIDPQYYAVAELRIREARMQLAFDI